MQHVLVQWPAQAASGVLSAHSSGGQRAQMAPPDEEAGHAASAEQGISTELARNRNNFSDVSLSDSPRCYYALPRHTGLPWQFLIVTWMHRT